jgi:hypothetical protein
LSRGRIRPIVGLGVGLVSLSAVVLGSAGPAGAVAVSPLSAVVIASPDPGYTLTSQGPVSAGTFVQTSPRPAAAAAALRQLSASGDVSSYQRIWLGTQVPNEIQDLVVRLSSVHAAQAFLAADQQALASGNIIHTQPLPVIAGATITAYAAATPQAGTGQAITMRSGTYVATLSFFTTTAVANPSPITPAEATSVALAQYTTMNHAPGGGLDVTATMHRDTVLGWIALAAAVLLGGLAVAMFVRARRARRSRGSRRRGRAGTVTGTPGASVARFAASSGFNARRASGRPRRPVVYPGAWP